MADTKIEWADAVWNPIAGCSVVSPGCTNCYAMRQAARVERMGGAPHYAGLTRQTKAGPVWTGRVAIASDETLTAPLRWRKPKRIFVNSMSDLFHESVADALIDQIFRTMSTASHHTFIVLTKRAERMRVYLSDPTLHGRIRFEARPPWPLPNVWLGVSVEDQARADERIPHLLATPAAVRWISAEPLLGPVDLRTWLENAWKIKTPRRTWDDFRWPDWVPESVRLQIIDFWQPRWGRGPDEWMQGAIANGQPAMGTQGRFPGFRDTVIEGRFIPAWNNIGRVIDANGGVHVVCAGAYQSRPPHLDWVVAGGESGPKARPMHLDWFRGLHDQCVAAGVPFFGKQLGPTVVMSRYDCVQAVAMGAGWRAHHAGAPEGTVSLLDRRGADPIEWPPELRRREFPGGSVQETRP